MNPSELAGLKFGRVYDNNVWADKRGHLDWARPVVPGAPSAEDSGQIAHLLALSHPCTTPFIHTRSIHVWLNGISRLTPASWTEAPWPTPDNGPSPVPETPMSDSSGTSPPGLMVLVPTITIARSLGELREELERAPVVVTKLQARQFRWVHLIIYANPEILVF